MYNTLLKLYSDSEIISEPSITLLTNHDFQVQPKNVSKNRKRLSLIVKKGIRTLRLPQESRTLRSTSRIVTHFSHCNSLLAL